MLANLSELQYVALHLCIVLFCVASPKYTFPEVGQCKSLKAELGSKVLVTWLHLRTHHFWHTTKEVGLITEDHLPERCS